MPHQTLGCGDLAHCADDCHGRMPQARQARQSATWIARKVLATATSCFARREGPS